MTCGCYDTGAPGEVVEKSRFIERFVGYVSAVADGVEPVGSDGESVEKFELVAYVVTAARHIVGDEVVAFAFVFFIDLGSKNRSDERRWLKANRGVNETRDEVSLCTTVVESNDQVGAQQVTPEAAGSVEAAMGEQVLVVETDKRDSVPPCPHRGEGFKVGDDQVGFVCLE